MSKRFIHLYDFTQVAWSKYVFASENYAYEQRLNDYFCWAASVEAKSRRLSLFVFASFEIHRAEAETKHRVTAQLDSILCSLFSGLVNLTRQIKRFYSSIGIISSGFDVQWRRSRPKHKWFY